MLSTKIYYNAGKLLYVYAKEGLFFALVCFSFHCHVENHYDEQNIDKWSFYLLVQCRGLLCHVT